MTKLAKELPTVIAERLKTLAPSSTFAVEAKVKELRARGVNVISFGAGEPDFDTPEHIKDAAMHALHRGQTKYTEVGGIRALRAAVCTKLKRDNGLDYEPADVIVSCGSKHTLFNIMMTLINAGDEVVIPSPFWVSYPEQVRLVGGIPVTIETQEAAGFEMNPQQVRAAVTPRTKVIILNSPNNPTGAILSPEVLHAVGALAIEDKLWIVSDETYEAFTFEERHQSIASFGPEIRARTFVVNTCSKAYAMTGWRIGYAAGPRDLIQAMIDVQSQVTASPSSIAQWAAIEALTGPQDQVRQMAREFGDRRRLMVEGLNAIPGMRCSMPKGGFYAFPNITGLLGRRTVDGKILNGSFDVATFLLEHAYVAVVPGVDFGSDAHVRLSYAVSTALIHEGLDRIGAAIHQLSERTPGTDKSTFHRVTR